MHTLTASDVNRANEAIQEIARPLELARWNVVTSIDPEEKREYTRQVLEQLGEYQNEDGGFGKHLEPDFALPTSSPLATSFALDVVDELGLPVEDPGVRDLVGPTCRYLEDTFDKDARRWWTVSAEVNEYPHAVWWNYDENTGKTVLDQSWGNPTAKLTGYLHTYRERVQNLDVDELVNGAISQFLDKNEFTSEHELYCYIRLYKHLPEAQGQRMQEHLRAAVADLVVTDPEEWVNYVAEPLHFAHTPVMARALALANSDVQANLDYLVGQIKEHGVISPAWNWHQYPDEWEVARQQWTGILTVTGVRVLRAYGRLELEE